MSQQLVIGIVSINGFLNTGWEVLHLSTHHDEVAAIIHLPESATGVQNSSFDQQIIDLITEFDLYKRNGGDANGATWFKGVYNK